MSIWKKERKKEKKKEKHLVDNKKGILSEGEISVPLLKTDKSYKILVFGCMLSLLSDSYRSLSISRDWSMWNILTEQRPIIRVDSNEEQN